MKTNVLIAFLLFSFCTCYAQKQLCFSYDSSGNQTNAIICLHHANTSSSDRTLPQVEEEENADIFKREEFLEDIILKAAPNPTDGNLTIFWHHYKGKGLIRLFISSADLRILYDNTFINSSSEHIELNVHSYIPGIYYLVGIFEDGTKKTFRIIKK
ncbi:T9SS type A sorting domain-containing protein [Capnocytophaga canimorsus]|uniref:T9SS type A sorting domain-containing protein n=1 Tax=Capnocytophaga canimorsus TaxID=28188 RepID=UPI0037D05A59